MGDLIAAVNDALHDIALLRSVIASKEDLTAGDKADIDRTVAALRSIRDVAPSPALTREALAAALHAQDLVLVCFHDSAAPFAQRACIKLADAILSAIGTPPPSAPTARAHPHCPECGNDILHAPGCSHAS